jgi:RNA polymerase sigma-70 factor (ECF subfamily)
MDDATAVAQARAGDEEAFRLLVERHSRALFEPAYRITGNEHDAEDVVQESFLKAYRSLDRFEERSQVGRRPSSRSASCRRTRASRC